MWKQRWYFIILVVMGLWIMDAAVVYQPKKEYLSEVAEKETKYSPSAHEGTKWRHPASSSTNSEEPKEPAQKHLKKNSN